MKSDISSPELGSIITVGPSQDVFANAGIVAEHCAMQQHDLLNASLVREVVLVQLRMHVAEDAFGSPDCVLAQHDSDC